MVKMSEQSVTLEARLIRNEVTIHNIEDDIKDIKRNVRWIIGIIFSLNGTIIGLLAKALSLM
jgi:hypothetical protein